MIMTTPDPYSAALSAQREYVACCNAGIPFAAHDSNQKWIWRLEESEVLPELRKDLPKSECYVLLWLFRTDYWKIAPCKVIDWLDVAAAM